MRYEKPSRIESEGFLFLTKCKVVVRQIDSCIVVFWINYRCKVKGKHILGKLSFRHSICEKGVGGHGETLDDLFFFSN